MWQDLAQRSTTMFTAEQTIMQEDAVLCHIEEINQSTLYVQNSQIAYNKYEEKSETNYQSVRLNP